MRSYALLFDLDGLLADNGHRLRYLRRDPPDYAAYFAAADSDNPIPASSVIFNLLATQCRILGHQIKQQGIDADTPFVDVITWRPESMRAQVISWFATCGLLMPRAIHMRRDGDERDGVDVKLEMIERNYTGKEEVLAIFEDNPKIVEAFKAKGIACFRAA